MHISYGIYYVLKVLKFKIYNSYIFVFNIIMHVKNIIILGSSIALIHFLNDEYIQYNNNTNYKYIIINK